MYCIVYFVISDEVDLEYIFFIQTANFFISKMLASKISNALNFVQKCNPYFSYFPL